MKFLLYLKTVARYLRMAQDPRTPKASPGVLIGFIEGEEGRIWGARSRAARFKGVVESFARYFGREARNVLGGSKGYVEMVWAQEEFTGGCERSAAPSSSSRGS